MRGAGFAIGNSGAAGQDFSGGGGQDPEPREEEAAASEDLEAGDGLDTETHKGLKRLAEFLQKSKQRGKVSETAGEVASEMKARRRQQAFQKYMMIQNSETTQMLSGASLNKVA